MEKEFRTMSVVCYMMLGVFILLFIVRCQNFVQPENDTQISKHEYDESHFEGQNCMNCHYIEGRGKAWFTVGFRVGAVPILQSAKL